MAEPTTTPATLSQEDLDKKVLDFTETSITRVNELEKRAGAAEKRAADAEARVEELEQELSTAKAKANELEKKASAPVTVFDPDKVRELSDLLCAAGFIKESSEIVQETFNSDPNTVLGVFVESLGGSDDAELTTIKSSSEHKPDLWRLAAAETK